MDGQPRPLHRSPPMRMSIFCQWTYYPAATAATSGASFTLGAHESGMHDAREHVPKLRGNFARDFLRLIVSTEQTTSSGARARRSSARRCLYLRLIIIFELLLRVAHRAAISSIVDFGEFHGGKAVTGEGLGQGTRRGASRRLRAG